LKTSYKPKILDGLNEGFKAKEEKNDRNCAKHMGKDITRKGYVI
jgi:hypothetical protein